MANIKYLVDLDLNSNELQNAVLQNISGPTGGIAGQIVYDTSDDSVKVSDGTSYLRVGLTADGTTITDSSGTISVGTIGISNVAGLASQLNNKVDDSQVLTDVPANALFTDEDVSTGNLFDRLAQISAMVLGDGTGSVTINGDFSVLGNTTTLETANLLVEDNIITLNSTALNPALDAGIEVNRGPAEDTPALKWDESAGRWTFTNDGTNFYNIPLPSQYGAGDITAVVAGDGLTGGATSGSATLTNEYNRIVTQAQGVNAYASFNAEFAQFVPESIEVVVKEIAGNKFTQVITDVIVDLNLLTVNVYLPTGDYFISFSGIRA